VVASSAPVDGLSCELVVVLTTPLGGIVPCSAEGCTRKVRWFTLRRHALGLALLERPVYVCDEDRTEVRRLVGVDTLALVAEDGSVKHNDGDTR